MAELNEEQLLLLNNLMYYKNSSQTGTSVKDLVNEILNTDPIPSNMLSGSLSSKDMHDIAKAIEADTTLCELEIAGSVDKNAVRASCFVDPNGEATIAIRGTGGPYDAWEDNFQGAYDTNTECQETLREFVIEQGQYYDDITITGHSKGGNMAQYATILEGDLIDRCVSFDGQGFNEDFHRIYADEIAANRDKIKSINGYKDYVNILLYPVAGETIYLYTEDTPASAFEDNHSSYNLWNSNREKTDANGNYDHTAPQDPAISVIDRLIDEALEKIDDSCGPIGERIIIDIIGGIISSIPSTDTYETWKERFENFPEFIQQRIKEWIPDWIKSPYKKIDVRCPQLKRYAQEMDACKTKIDSLIAQLDDIDLKGFSYVIVETQLRRRTSNLRTVNRRVERCANALDKVVYLYESTENALS